MVFKIPRPRGIAIDPIVGAVMTAVDLYNQPESMVRKISEERTYGCLPPKMPFRKIEKP